MAGVTDSSNRAIRASIWLMEAPELIGTTPLMKVAAGPARAPTVTLLVVLQAEATAAVGAAGFQEPLPRVLMVDFVANGLREKLNSWLDLVAEMTLTP